MTAPDKIYIRESNDGLSDMWYYEKRLHPSIFATHEYIRKDALLEWLEGKMTVEEATEGIVGGYNSALKDVISKLNSM